MGWGWGRNAPFNQHARLVRTIDPPQPHHHTTQADLPNGGFPAEVTVRTADVYADTPEAREEVARGIRTQDLVLSARLDRGAWGGGGWLNVFGRAFFFACLYIYMYTHDRPAGNVVVG